MKKISLILMTLIIASACTNQKVIEYNSARLDNIEKYLKENKNIKPSKNLEQLKEENKIKYSEEYKSLEREAEEWLKTQQK